MSKRFIFAITNALALLGGFAIATHLANSYAAFWPQHEAYKHFIMFMGGYFSYNIIMVSGENNG